MSLIGVKNEQNPAVFVQVRYRERDEIRCLRLPTSAAKGANNAKKKSQFGASYPIFNLLTPSNSTSLTASISTRWSQVVSRPYFNKKKRHLSLFHARAHVYILYIIRSLFQRILSDPLRYFHECVPPTFNFDNGFI